MALDEMLRALEEDSKKECEEIMARAKQNAERIVAEAKEDAKRVKQDEIAKVISGLEGERERVLNETRLAIKKEAIRAKEEVIQEVFSEVDNRLEKVRESPDYSGIFESLALETLEGIEGRIKVEVDQKDLALAKSILETKKLDYWLEASPASSSGFKVTSEDGRITITNTLNSRLEKASQFLRSEIAKALFG